MKTENDAKAGSNSTWRNPSKKHTARITLQRPDHFAGETDTHPNVEFTVSIAPGETAVIPSQYDRAIVHVSGERVMGGICPWLVRVDPPEQWDRGDLFAVPDAIRAPVLLTSRTNTTTGAPRRKLED